MPKMKRLIISMIVTIFTLGLFAQSKPIDVTTIQGDGYTYIKETIDATLKVKLYNQENEYVNVPLVYKETGKRPPYDLREKRVEDDNWSSLRAELIVNQSFTTEQMQIIKDHKLGVGIYVDTTTGKVVGVEFRFLKISPFADIPISTFREIELKMKREIYFTLTEAGKKLNYVYLGWIQDIVDMSIIK